jgi:hypothetical protein
MNFWLKRFSLLILSFFITGVAVQAQSGSPRRGSDPAQLQSGNSSVQGRVVYSDNGQPMKKVRVTIFNPLEGSGDAQRVVVTNDRGEFVLTGLPAGKYYATIEGRKAPLPSGLSVRIPLPVAAIPRAEDYAEIVPRHDAEFVVDGKNSTTIEIRFTRGGTVAGKVMQANGSPVSDATVNLVSSPDSTTSYGARFSGRTDKNGAFRLENVPPAKYIVSAAVESQQGSADIYARMRGETQSVTYHPAALRLADALPINVESGREASGINITLVERRSFSVSGTVVRGLDGSALSGAQVVLRRKDAETAGPEMPGLQQRNTQTNSKGEWSFSNVEEGAYEITALNSPSGPIGRTIAGPPGMMRRTGPPRMGQVDPGPRPRFMIAQQSLDVIGAKVEDITLTIGGPGTIVGNVVLEDGQPVPAGAVLFFEFGSAGARPGRPVPVRVNSDGSFRLDDVQSGQTYLNPALPPDSRYFVDSATLSGNDVSAGINVLEGAEIGPLTIRLSDKLATVAGRITTSENGAKSGLVVLLVPVDPAKQRFRTSYFSTFSSTDGSFSVKVAPGEYFVIARQRADLPAVIMPEFMRAFGAGTQRVAVGPSEQKSIDLVVRNN